MNNTQREHSRAGFTLLEVLISLAIFSMIFIALLAMLDSHSRVSQSGEIKADVQQNARIAMETISRDLRHAGFFPETFLDPPEALPPGLPGGGLSVLLGTNNALAVAGYTSPLASPLPNPLPPGVTSEVVFYFVNGTDLMRKVIPPPPGPTSFVLSGGAIAANNVTAVTFTYFDGASAALAIPLDNVLADGTAPTFVTTTARQAVRRIVVTITLNEPVPGQGVQVYTLTSDVHLRNGCAPIRPACQANLL